MAILTITELKDLGFDPHGNDVMAPAVPAVFEQAVAIGNAPEPSAAFQTLTRYIMVNCDTPCCLAFGASPTAVVGLHRMGANETRFYTVQGGQFLSVIQST